VLGHQIGSGTGRTVRDDRRRGRRSVCRQHVEKNKNRNSYWLVAIKMDNGNTEAFTTRASRVCTKAERVKLIDGGRRLALVAN
jgi:outer membrane lipoprotein SlyB